MEKYTFDFEFKLHVVELYLSTEASSEIESVDTSSEHIKQLEDENLTPFIMQ